MSGGTSSEPTGAVTSGPTVVGGVLAGHGDFANGLYSALRAIVGEVPDFKVVSGQGMTTNDWRQVIDGIRQRSQAVIVFTDMPGGGSTNVCQSLARDCTDIRVVCGVNLPVLIKFVQYRARLPLAELCSLLIQAGREGIRVVPGSESTGQTSAPG